MKICAITTTYYPDENIILENFNRIKDYIDKYIIVDNSDNYEFKMLNSIDNIVIIQNKINSGVAKGINIGIEKVSEYNPKYVVLFDQDSLSDKDMLPVMINTIQKKENIRILTPNIVDYILNEEIHKKYFKIDSDKSIKSIESTQLSGMIVEYDVLKIHKFNEKYFLNLVDSEWCWRVKKNGLEIFLQPSAKLFHSFGHGKKKFIKYTFYYGKPFRMYYTTRDILYSLRFSDATTQIKTKLLIKFFISWLEVILLDNKTLRWKFLCLGVRHYFKGIRGKGIEI